MLHVAANILHVVANILRVTADKAFEEGKNSTFFNPSLIEEPWLYNISLLLFIVCVWAWYIGLGAGGMDIKVGTWP